MSDGSPELTVDGPIATVTLRRPAQANRLTPDDLQTLAAQFAEVDGRPEILVLLLRGTGTCFCSGFDIGSIGGDRPVDFAGTVDALEQIRPVTIAVLHGGVYGGATDLALACDFRVGSEHTNLFMPAARLGLHYYRSGLERCVSRLGVDNAKRLFLTAEKLSAARMKEIGFLTDLVGAEQLDVAVADLAGTCAAMAPIALLGMKHHLNRIARGTLDADGLQRDVQRAMASDDLREGRSAWLARRAPRFTGH